MKLNQYIKKLKKFLKEHPEAKDFEVVSSSDEEGNSFFPVDYDPTLGWFEGRDFTALDELKDNEPCNSVCIN